MSAFSGRRTAMRPRAKANADTITRDNTVFFKINIPISEFP